MMAELEVWLTDLVIYLANGLLTAGYWLGEQADRLAAVAAAVLIAATFDVLAQRDLAFAPDRYRGGAALATRPPRSAQALTLIALALWLAASWSFGPPVPAIGAVMWGGAAVFLLLMPQQRWSLLWTVKGYLILYSLAVLGYRFLLWQAARIAPGQLAAMLGGAQAAGQVVAQNTQTLTTIGAWLLWAILPAGYFALFLQNLLAQPLSLANPFQEARDVIAILRHRGAAGAAGDGPFLERGLRTDAGADVARLPGGEAGRADLSAAGGAAGRGLDPAPGCPAARAAGGRRGADHPELRHL